MQHGVRTRCSGFGNNDSGNFTFVEPELQNRIGTSYGSTPCIEERLFQHVMQQLAQRYSSAERALKEELSMNKATLRRLLNQQFEPYKKDFKTPKQQPYIISVSGTNLQGMRNEFRTQIEA